MGAMPTLVVGMSCFPAFPYMPTGVSAAVPHRGRVAVVERSGRVAGVERSEPPET